MLPYEILRMIFQASDDTTFFAGIAPILFRWEPALVEKRALSLGIDISTKPMKWIELLHYVFMKKQRKEPLSFPKFPKLVVMDTCPDQYTDFYYLLIRDLCPLAETRPQEWGWILPLLIQDDTIGSALKRSSDFDYLYRSWGPAPHPHRRLLIYVRYGYYIDLIPDDRAELWTDIMSSHGLQNGDMDYVWRFLKARPQIMKRVLMAAAKSPHSCDHPWARLIRDDRFLSMSVFAEDDDDDQEPFIRSCCRYFCLRRVPKTRFQQKQDDRDLRSYADVLRMWSFLKFTEQGAPVLPLNDLWIALMETVQYHEIERLQKWKWGGLHRFIAWIGAHLEDLEKRERALIPLRGKTDMTRDALLLRGCFIMSGKWTWEDILFPPAEKAPSKYPSRHLPLTQDSKTYLKRCLRQYFTTPPTPACRPGQGRWWRELTC